MPRWIQITSSLLLSTILFLSLCVELGHNHEDNQNSSAGFHELEHTVSKAPGICSVCLYSKFLNADAIVQFQLLLEFSADRYDEFLPCPSILQLVIKPNSRAPPATAA
jgi:hypothetical protein